MKKLTLKDLREAKGRRQLTEVLTTDIDEARACETAGIDMLVTAKQFTKAMREAAPNTFLISRRVSILMSSMGSGPGCDAQYLFACDILGANTGHVPRHAKVYADLNAEMERIQGLRVEAFQAFCEDVRSGKFPTSAQQVKVDSEELKRFVARL